MAASQDVSKVVAGPLCTKIVERFVCTQEIAGGVGGHACVYLMNCPVCVHPFMHWTLPVPTPQLAKESCTPPSPWFCSDRSLCCIFLFFSNTQANKYLYIKITVALCCNGLYMVAYRFTVYWFQRSLWPKIYIYITYMRDICMDKVTKGGSALAASCTWMRRAH